MHNIQEILENAADSGASDIFLIAGLPVTVKEGGMQRRIGSEPLMPKIIDQLILQAYELSGRARSRIDSRRDDDFSLSLSEHGGFEGGRFRFNVFRQRGSTAAVVRVIRFELPDPVKLGITEDVLSLADIRGSGTDSSGSGLILVTGAAGAGKSTTLACMVDRINETRSCHIITMEDPIEYIHRHKKAIVTQREISIDTPGYPDALRSAMRESPDVILLGEMRDYETISAAVTAAETGVLVLSTLHTNSAADAVSRIMEEFPDKADARVRLSQVLRAVVCQQLVPSTAADGHRIPAFEVMKSAGAVQNLIREDKISQLASVMQSGASEGMRTMDGSLLELHRQGRITMETALKHRTRYGHEYMEKRLRDSIK